MDEPTFRYTTTCAVPGCAEAPRYKVAAAWSDGPLREWKNYGLACETHLEALLARAGTEHDRVAMRDDEQVGPVQVFELPRPSIET